MIGDENVWCYVGHSIRGVSIEGNAESKGLDRGFDTVWHTAHWNWKWRDRCWISGDSYRRYELLYTIPVSYFISYPKPVGGRRLVLSPVGGREPLSGAGGGVLARAPSHPFVGILAQGKRSRHSIPPLNGYGYVSVVLVIICARYNGSCFPE